MRTKTSGAARAGKSRLSPPSSAPAPEPLPTETVADVGTAMPAILATIRAVESGGNYQAEASGSSASGAYQFIDGTWQSCPLAETGHAAYASDRNQDSCAAWLVGRIWTDDHRLVAIPLRWYCPCPLDEVPGGNRLTPREYAERWLARWEEK